MPYFNYCPTLTAEHPFAIVLPMLSRQKYLNSSVAGTYHWSFLLALGHRWLAQFSIEFLQVAQTHFLLKLGEFCRYY